jgi:hypothetical protein
MAKAYIRLPDDSSTTGKPVVAWSYTDAGAPGGTGYAQGAVLADSSGNLVDTLTSTPAGTERAVAVRQVGNVGVSNFPASQPVTDNGGSLTIDSTQLPASNGQKAMAASLPVVVASDQSAVPVSGTVTANAGTGTLAISAASLPLPSGAAADATLTGGTQKAIARGGAKGSTSAADVTSVAVDANTQALHTSVTNFPTTQPVSGTVTANAGTGTLAISAASLPLPTGAAADATLTGGTQKSITRGGAKGATGAADVTSTAVDANTQALDVQVRNFPATQPVSGTVTANAGTGPFPVSDNGGSLTVDSAQLPSALVSNRLDVNVGAALPTGANVIGNVGVAQGGLTAAVRQIVSGGTGLSVVGGSQPNTTGNITTTTTTVTSGDLGMANTIGVTINGTYAGVNVTFEASTDNTNWQLIQGTRLDTGALETSSGVLPANTIRMWSFTFGGAVYFRVRATAWTSGSAAVTIDPGTLPLTPVAGVVLNPSTTGGWLKTRLLAAATTNATLVKNAPGQLGGWFFANLAAAVRYLKIYDLAAAPTVGTSTPALTIPLQGLTAANIEFAQGIQMGTGISFALTTGVADTDTGALTANDVALNLFYR